MLISLLAHKDSIPQDTTTDHPRAIRKFSEILEPNNKTALGYLLWTHKISSLTILGSGAY
ncbi:MAG: hypothetical protein A2057_12265 [Ignavibacteria bacterium GWA2_35_9]|nr:MAG: hypothetical protein A2057_12265 [Ignavibacteria bacterium GWA2_35_9]OGU44407.1 MAG: hypothetical protein A2000_05840 [Ignavibacteria bacterium GWB2_36_8]OGU52342.1 MAG: hypothetical protein A2080_09665 [Ignavibacteria bacterium GWC2_36_12]OGV13432.1 MAG: hypothetical protein A3J84_04275 [Ignavibacteria bacterium RIFOXYA2_FULL_37_17]